MTEIDLDKMEAGARAAPQDELDSTDCVVWTPIAETFEYMYTQDDGMGNPEPAFYEEVSWHQVKIADTGSPELAIHIANCDPPTIIALIARLREAEKKK